MPSKSQKQHDTMVAACKSPEFATKAGIPQDVACEFVKADKDAGLWQKKVKSSSLLKIKEGSAKDIEAFIFFRRIASGESVYNNLYTKEDAERVFGDIKKDSDKEVYFLFDEEEIVGELFIEIKKNELYISKISVLGDYQGSKIGASKKLLDKAIAIAEEKGLDSISLIVRNDNERAIGFYKKNGFTFLKDYNKNNKVYHLNILKNHSSIKKETKKDIAVVIKGNPEFIKKEENKKLAKDFYDTIAEMLRKLGFKVEFDAGKDFTVPNKNATVWIAHSRGISRLKFASPDIICIALETNNPEDGDSADHYELSPNDIRRINSLPKPKKKSIYHKW